MVFEVLRGCAQIAAEITDMTATRARAVVRDLLPDDGVGGSRLSHQISALTGEVVAAGKANGAQLGALAGKELDRLLGALDLARADDLTRLRERVAELESRLAAPAAQPGKAGRTKAVTGIAPAVAAGAATGHTAGGASANVNPTARTSRSRTAGATRQKPAARKSTRSTPGGDA
jgi:hypothetical protein